MCNIIKRLFSFTNIAIFSGLILSFFYMYLLSIYFNISYESLKEIPKKDMADIIAIFSTPIAFLWLIISNILQGIGLNQSHKNSMESNEISQKLIHQQQKEKSEKNRKEHNLSQPLIEIEVFENLSFLDFYNRKIYQKNLFEDDNPPTSTSKNFNFEGKIRVRKNPISNLKIQKINDIPIIMEAEESKIINFHMTKSDSEKVILDGSYNLEVSFEDSRSEIQKTSLKVINELGQLKLYIDSTLIRRKKDVY